MLRIKKGADEDNGTRKNRARELQRIGRGSLLAWRRAAGVSGATVALDGLLLALLLFFHLRGSEFQDGFAHFLAGLELDDGAGRDGNIRLGSVWVPADAGLPNFYFEDAEVSEFDFLAFGDGVGYVIKRLLNDVEHVLLYKAGLLTNPHYQVTLCHKVDKFVVELTGMTEPVLRL